MLQLFRFFPKKKFFFQKHNLIELKKQSANSGRCPDMSSLIKIKKQYKSLKLFVITIHFIRVL